MRRILRGAATLIGAGVLTLPTIFLPAFAARPADVFRDADNNVYIIGATADGLGTSTRVETDQPYTRNVRAGYCGELRINTTSTVPDIGDSWTVGSNTITQASLTSLTGDNLPSCVSNSFAPTPTVTNWIDGNYTDGTRERVVFSGFTPGQRQEVTYNDVNRTRNIRENDCGFFRIGNTASNPMGTTIGIDGTTYTVASLPLAEGPSSRSGVCYEPVSWQ